MKKNANDLEAVVKLADLQSALGQPEEGLKTLRAADPKKIQMLDSRTSGGSPSRLHSLQCQILLRQNKLAEAHAACMRAIEMGSTIGGPAGLGEILYLQDKLEEALPHFDKVLEADPRYQRASLLAALVNQRLARS